jgi:hypothetical protein
MTHRARTRGGIDAPHTVGRRRGIVLILEPSGSDLTLGRPTLGRPTLGRPP